MFEFSQGNCCEADAGAISVMEINAAARNILVIVDYSIE